MSSRASLRGAIAPRTNAIIAVHSFGLAAPMDEINAIARMHNLAVIEDAACAIGTGYKRRYVGRLGDIGCFSFHTASEGGAVRTNRDELAAFVRSQRNHGATDPAGTVFGSSWSIYDVEI